ncbi:unnamed protein product [Acanthosepion pharaonis]|uniref:Uncharacterized protein n=1 Tax=Acanthosepion pharaonis TaxID=158019 RepID=A0A812B690_ACAPH|nr:unnamed protein product [Sepia pharaonis]
MESSLQKLSGGDVVALEVKIPPSMPQNLYNAERAYLNSLEKAEGSDPGKDLYPVAFSELVIYNMDSKVTNTEAAPVVFQLAGLDSPYKLRLEQLGVDSPNVHSTRLKEQLLARIPELEAHKKGHDVLLAFKADIGPVLHEASQYSNALHLSKAADILRKEMLQHKTKFSSELKDCFAEEAIPPALLQFVCRIEHGVDIKSHLTHGIAKSDLANPQLLQFNCYSKRREDLTTQIHSKDREVPFAVYVGLKVYAKTRKRELIGKFHEHGLSISYDRVLEISGKIGETVINCGMSKKMLCAHQCCEKGCSLRPLSTTLITIPRPPQLAPYFKKNPTPASVDEVSLPDPSLFQRNIRVEYKWFEKVQGTTDVDDESNITWSAHHASQKRTRECETSITSLLPLLRDQAHSVAAIKHAMKKVREAVVFLNPGQTPVLAADQPLYAMAKEIQRYWPEEYGEDKFVIMFVGLHIEMTALKSIGSMLADSGWTSALVEADVASSGTAD